MKLPVQPPQYNRGLEQQRSAAIERGFAELSQAAKTVLTLVDGVTDPNAETGVAKIYVDSSDGDLKIIFSDGTVKTIVTDT